MGHILKCKMQNYTFFFSKKKIGETLWDVEWAEFLDLRQNARSIKWKMINWTSRVKTSSMRKNLLRRQKVKL